jgi:hypothetical protein
MSATANEDASVRASDSVGVSHRGETVHAVVHHRLRHRPPDVDGPGCVEDVSDGSENRPKTVPTPTVHLADVVRESMPAT